MSKHDEFQFEENTAPEKDCTCAEEQEQPKKKAYVEVPKKVGKGFLMVLLFPIVTPIKFAWAIIMNLINLIITIVFKGPSILKDSYLGIRKTLNEAKKESPFLEWEEIMARWGITNQLELSQKQREYIFHAGVWSILIIIGLVQIYDYQSLNNLILGLLCLLPGLYGVLLSCWRLQVIKQRRFVTFFEWLKGN